MRRRAEQPWRPAGASAYGDRPAGFYEAVIQNDLERFLDQLPAQLSADDIAEAVVAFLGLPITDLSKIAAAMTEAADPQVPPTVDLARSIMAAVAPTRAEP